MNYLNIPGLNNSGPQHWQTLWEQAHPQKFKRVIQKNWSLPEKNEWVQELDKNIKLLSAPLILVAHSLGCITVAHWAKENDTSPVAGVLFVAPADVEKSSRECFKTFCPVPLEKFSFPSIVAASTNDQYAAIEKSARLAAYWGSKFICVGDKGHINADSGIAGWKEGLHLLSLLNKQQENLIRESFV